MRRAVKREAMRTERRMSDAINLVLRSQFVVAKARRVWHTMNFDWVASDEWADEIYRLTHGLIRMEADHAASSAAKALNVSLTDFAERPRVIRALKDHTYRFARAVNDSTADALAKTMASGTERGESVEALTERVSKVFGYADDENYRARRIARTESARAYTTGEEELWKETGVVEAKVWDAARDACPFCIAMNGKTVALGQVFFKQGADQVVKWEGKDIVLHHGYLPVEGPPLHPNCRCALAAQLMKIYE